MSRLFKFVLVLAGAGAAVAILRHLTRQRAEEAKPFFADAYVPPVPAPPEAVVVPTPEPVVEPASPRSSPRARRVRAARHRGPA